MIVKLINQYIDLKNESILIQSDISRTHNESNDEIKGAIKCVRKIRFIHESQRELTIIKLLKKVNQEIPELYDEVSDEIELAVLGR